MTANSGELQSDVLSAANIVTGLLTNEFEHITDHEIDLINKDPGNIKAHSVVRAGSVRQFAVEDYVNGTYVGIVESYFLWDRNGTPSDAHAIILFFEHAYDNYSCTIDMDNGDVEVAVKGISALFKPQRYPAIRQRILGGLSLAADELF